MKFKIVHVSKRPEKKILSDFTKNIQGYRYADYPELIIIKYI